MEKYSRIRRPLVPLLAIHCLVIIVILEIFHIDLYKTRFDGSFGNVVSIEGTVKAAQLKSYYAAVTVDVGSENVLVKLSGWDDAADVYSLVGRRVKARGLIEKPSGQRNPGCFNYGMYLRARRIYSVMEVSKYKFEAGGIVNPVSNYLAASKGLFYEALREMIGEGDASLIFAVLFGDKSFLDSDIYTQFQTNGIAHVLAVSGLHVGLVYAALRKFIKRKDKSASALSVAFLLMYMVLADFSVSVVRAGIMIFLKIIAFHRGRRYDMLSAACFTAILMLAVNPYYIYDTGTQLSFTAVYGLAVVCPYFDIKLKKYCDRHKSDRLYKLGSIMLPGVVMQITMVPLTAFHFLNFAPLALFINPVAIYIASLLLPAGLICYLLYPFKIALAGSSALAALISRMLQTLSALSDKLLPGFSVPAPPLGLLLLYYVFIFFFFSEARHILIRKAQLKTAAGLLAFFVCFAAVFPFVCGRTNSLLPWEYSRYDAVFVDVGQGDCIHIQSRGLNVLVDGGGSYYSDVASNTLKPYLLKNGVSKIDVAIVSHLDTDHSKGIADLSSIMKIKTIVFPESVKGSDVSAFSADEIIYLKAGDSFSVGDAKFSVLSAGDPGSSDANSGSLVAICSIGELDILLTGDAPESVENRLVASGALLGRHIEILKAGHHGSNTSTGEMLLSANTFDVAVISCGKNNRYGHPTQRVLEALESSGIIIRRTDLEGAICISQRSILSEQ